MLMSSNKLHCVAGFVRDSLGRIVFIRKNKPEWQAGLLNGVGGKCEIVSQERHPGGKVVWEDPLACMIREWDEEIGFHLDVDWDQFAVIESASAVVYFFRAEVDDLSNFDIPAQNDAGEAVELHDMMWVVRGYEDCIKNLQWLLPLAFCDNRLTQHVTSTIKEAA